MKRTKKMMMKNKNQMKMMKMEMKYIVEMNPLLTNLIMKKYKINNKDKMEANLLTQMLIMPEKVRVIIMLKQPVIMKIKINKVDLHRVTKTSNNKMLQVKF